MSEIRENDSFASIDEAISRCRRVAVVGHVRPDGDAIGSQMGLGESLRKMGKEVVILNEDGVPESLAFLPGSGEVRRSDGRAVAADAVFALDTATRPRLGAKTLESLADVPLWINIDHHVTNPRYGHLNFIDPVAPATAQVLFELIDACAWPLNQDAATCLFAALSTDTGSFQYPNTTARSFEIGAQLIRHGVCVGEVSQKLYENYPYRRIELTRELLNALTLSHDNRVASWRLSQEQVKRLGLQPDDSEGLIDVIRAIDSVEVAVFFEELADGQVRISARSKSSRVDVGQICSHFGGGGHRLAAGARMPGPVSEAEAKFLAKVYEALSRN